MTHNSPAHQTGISFISATSLSQLETLHWSHLKQLAGTDSRHSLTTNSHLLVSENLLLVDVIPTGCNTEADFITTIMTKIRLGAEKSERTLGIGLCQTECPALRATGTL